MENFQSEQPRVGIIANPWLRLAAYFLDAIFISIPTMILFVIFFGTTYMAMFSDPQQFEDNPEAIIPFIMGLFAFIGIILVGQVIYFAYFESSAKQATLGKQIVGIYVTDMNGERITFANALGRFFAKILSGMIMYVGYIMILFTEKNQGLHDMIASTLVMQRDKSAETRI